MATIGETFKLIESFSQLPKGWNFGEGAPSSPVALGQSKMVLSLARQLGMEDAEAFPGIDGEIQVCLYSKDLTLEITFEKDATATIIFEKGDEIVSNRTRMHFDDTIRILKDFKFKCDSYELSTSNYITAQGKRDLQVWHLNPRHQMAVSPSLTANVQNRSVVVSANTLISSIKELAELPLFFGKFHPKKSPIIAT